MPDPRGRRQHVKGTISALREGKRLARAADPIHNPRPAGTTARWLGGSATLILVIGLLAARPTPILGVDGKALQHSVGGGILGSSTEPCQPAAGGTWNCDVYDDNVSGTVLYQVKVGDLGCWSAIHADWTGKRTPRPLTGCLTFWD